MIHMTYILLYIIRVHTVVKTYGGIFKITQIPVLLYVTTSGFANLDSQPSRPLHVTVHTAHTYRTVPGTVWVPSHEL